VLTPSGMPSAVPTGASARLTRSRTTWGQNRDTAGRGITHSEQGLIREPLRPGAMADQTGRQEQKQEAPGGPLGARSGRRSHGRDHARCRKAQGAPAATPARIGGVQVGHRGVGERGAADHHLGHPDSLFSNLRPRALLLGGFGHAPGCAWGRFWSESRLTREQAAWPVHGWSIRESASSVRRRGHSRRPLAGRGARTGASRPPRGASNCH
jgi:hypothetical protein